MNIIWLRPDGGISVTHIVSSKIDLTIYAKELQKRGDVPGDWKVKAKAIKLPADKVFREAWSWTTKKLSIDISMDKAKEIVHNKRRIKREVEFESLDKLIMINASNPSAVETIESDRINIRTKYDQMQTAIDTCTNESALRSLIETGAI